jgi:hypothetical protein
VSKTTEKLVIGFKALRELGLRSLALYVRYQVLIRFPSLLRTSSPRVNGSKLKPLLSLPDKETLASVLGEDGRGRLLAEADEIASGQVRLFGADPQLLKFARLGELVPWYLRARLSSPANTPGISGAISSEPQPERVPESGSETNFTDIKFIWEPGRFGWAYTLGRAYLLSGDERYPAAFWSCAEDFIQANPAPMGPHWESAQEVALRLIAFVFMAQIFATSPQTTPQRATLLAQAVADCAARIPSTLVYSRAQNNNHLLVEAAGLYTAGLALPETPQASSWRNLGWRWFNFGLLDQISTDGAYSQHSTNYHRLMLQIALWMASIATPTGDTFPAEVCQRLASAVHWLLILIEPEGGRVPNLGPNDGAYIFPLATCPFDDYRPVLQASAQAFLPGSVLAPALAFTAGPWDEMSLWLKVQPGNCSQVPAPHPSPSAPLTGVPLVPPPPHVLGDKAHSWAYVRAIRFDCRPGHADQLHMDLWWRGINIAQDPGTYLYNALPPWENALACSAVHNTISIDGQDQMRRAGRFLWLDWAQAQVTGYGKASDGSFERLVARHNGYYRLGVTHQRAVEWQAGSWLITDDLLPSDDRGGMLRAVTARLHWLLPDWPWQIGPEEIGQGMVVELTSPYGKVRLILHGKIPASGDAGLKLQLIRAGEMLYGAGSVTPIMGWYSPTYNVKVPALSLVATLENRPPFGFVTRWKFPPENKK